MPGAKPKWTERLTVSFEAGTTEKLEALADQGQISVSALLRTILVDFFDGENTKDPLIASQELVD